MVKYIHGLLLVCQIRDSYRTQPLISMRASNRSVAKDSSPDPISYEHYVTQKSDERIWKYQISKPL